MRPSDLPSISVNIPCGRKTFCKILSTFCVARRPSFPYGWDTFRHFWQITVHPGKFLSTSVKFSCSRETFRQPLSTLGTAGRPSVNFHLLSVWLGDLSLTSVNFPCGSESLLHHFVQLVDLLSTFRAAWRPTVNSGHLSVRTEDLLCTSVNFTYSLENFRRLPSNFPANKRSSVNFCQLSVRPGHLPLITEGLLAARKSDGRWRNVSWLHKKLTEEDGISPVGMERWRMENWWKLMEGPRPHIKLMKVYRWYPYYMESWQKLSEGLPAARKAEWSWRKAFLLHRKLTENDGNSHSFMECWQKVFWPHENFTKVVSRWYEMMTKVDGSSPGFIQSWQKVFWRHGKFKEVGGKYSGRTKSWRKLTEGRLARRKLMQRFLTGGNLTEIYRRLPGCTKTSWKLKKGLAAIRKCDGKSYGRKILWEVDGRSPGGMKILQMLTEGLPGHTEVDILSSGHTKKLMEVYRWSPGRMENWQNSTKGLLATKIVEGSWQKVSQPNSKLTEVDGMSPDGTKCGQKFMNGLAIVQKVDVSWREIYQLHGMLMGVDVKSPGRTEWIRKVSRPHKNLTQVDGSSPSRMEHGRSPGCTESWRKWTQSNAVARKVHGSWRKVFRWVWKLMEVYGRSPDRRECRLNMTKVSRLHRRLIECNRRYPGRLEN